MYTLRSVKNFKIFLTILSTLFIFSTALSEENNKKFAVVNIQKVTESSSVFQSIRDQMNEQFKKLSIKFDKQAKNIIDNESNLEKQKSVLDKAAYSEKISEINKSKQKIQSELESDKQKLQKIYFDTINDVNKKMSTIIEKISIENNYDAIFEGSTLIYNKLNNITDDIIKIMNKELPSYKIDFDAKVKPNTIEDDKK